MPQSLISQAFGEVVDTPWFLAVDMAGTVAFALSGITIARSERYSIFGALVLAWLPALGGGLVMDLIVGRTPPAILAQPAYMYAILVTVLAARLGLWAVDHARGRLVFFFDVVRWYLMVARRLPPRTALVLFDAIGLASFTVTGVFTAIQFNCQPLALWGPILAMMNASLGAMLRDVFRADAHNPILKGSFYAEVAILWGLFLSVYVQVVPHSAVAGGVAATLAGVPMTRLMLYRRAVSAPMF